MAAISESDIVLISAIEHYAYCPRQYGLIHIEQVYEENVYTLQGSAHHERADQPLSTREPGKRVERAIPLWSEQWGLQGRADTVEFLDDGGVRPVEYKRGARSQKEHDDLQLCAQALCLEEMLGRPVREGAVFYHASRRQRTVVFDEGLRARTCRAIEAIRGWQRAGRMPPPVNDSRCPNCSLVELCLPDALAAGAAEDAAAVFTADDEE